MKYRISSQLTVPGQLIAIAGAVLFVTSLLAAAVQALRAGDGFGGFAALGSGVVYVALLGVGVFLALNWKVVDMTKNGLAITRTRLSGTPVTIEVPFEDIVEVSQPLYLRWFADTVVVKFAGRTFFGDRIYFSAKYRMFRWLEHGVCDQIRNEQVRARLNEPSRRTFGAV